MNRLLCFIVSLIYACTSPYWYVGAQVGGSSSLGGDGLFSSSSGMGVGTGIGVGGYAYGYPGLPYGAYGLRSMTGGAMSTSETFIPIYFVIPV